MPPHHITLKVGMLIMLLRNFDHCNGLRYIIKQILPHFLVATFVIGFNAGCTLLITQINSYHLTTSFHSPCDENNSQWDPALPWLWISHRFSLYNALVFSAQEISSAMDNSTLLPAELADQADRITTWPSPLLCSCILRPPPPVSLSLLLIFFPLLHRTTRASLPGCGGGFFTEFPHHALEDLEEPTFCS